MIRFRISEWSDFGMARFRIADFGLRNFLSAFIPFRNVDFGLRNCLFAFIPFRIADFGIFYQHSFHSEIRIPKSAFVSFRNPHSFHSAIRILKSAIESFRNRITFFEVVRLLTTSIGLPALLLLQTSQSSPAFGCSCLHQGDNFQRDPFLPLKRLK